MNRENRVFTCTAAGRVIGGPWRLDSVKDWKGAYRVKVKNNGALPLVFVAQQNVGGVWVNVAAGPITVAEQCSRVYEFYICNATQWRFWGTGATEGAIDIIEQPDYVFQVGSR